MQDELFYFYKTALSGELTTPLCSEYKSAWRKCGNDKRMLVDLVLRQQSLPYFIAHCKQNKGLTKEYILDNFSEYINGNYTAIDVDGVKGDYKTSLYVAYNGVLSLSDDVSCFMWAIIPSLEIKATKAAKLYCGCSSEIHLVCGGYNSIIIMLFDDSKVILDDVDEDSSVTIYKYSDKAEVKMGKYCMSKKIKVFNKELRL